MLNLLKKVEQNNIDKLSKSFPEFKAGDTIRVYTKVKEDKTERLQAFEGICIARKNAGINSSFTVRKMSASVGVEKVFPLYGTVVDKIDLIKIGRVRRAKLYYLRGLQSKKARIAEDLNATKKIKEAIAKPVSNSEVKIDE